MASKALTPRRLPLLSGMYRMSLAVKGDIGRLALHDLVERDGDFVFRAGPFAAVDVGLLGGVGREAFGEGQHLEDGGIGAVLDGESAGLFDVADDVDAADFRDADFFAAGELEVEGGIGVVDEGADKDAAGQRDGLVIGAGLGLADEDFAAGILAESLGAGDGFEQGGGSFGLEDEGLLDGAGDADGAGVIFGDGDGDEGIDQDLLLAEGRGDGGFELGGEESLGLDAPLEHGEADVAIGADADGTGEFRGVVDGDGDQVVGADCLGGEVGADFGDNPGGLSLGLGLRPRRGGKG